MPAFTVVSFYTPNWKYPEYAQNLRADCDRLALDYAIESRDSTDSYVENCNIKPFFIREKLQEFKRPVLWIDVDGSIVKIPQSINILNDVDVAGYANKQFPERISVNVLLFFYTPNALSFLDTWCNYVKNSIDDGAFNKALTDQEPKIKLELLPPEQVVILHSRDNHIPAEACFVNRLSGSDLKWQYKNKVEGRR